MPTQNYVYRQDTYEEGEAEYDAADFNETFVEQDGTPFMLVSSSVHPEVLDKIKKFVAELTYEHG